MLINVHPVFALYELVAYKGLLTTSTNLREVPHSSHYQVACDINHAMALLNKLGVWLKCDEILG